MRSAAQRLYCCRVSIRLQAMMVRELFALARERDEDKSMPLFRTKQWSFFLVACFYLYGRCADWHYDRDERFERNHADHMPALKCQEHASATLHRSALTLMMMSKRTQGHCLAMCTLCCIMHACQ